MNNPNPNPNQQSSKTNKAKNRKTTKSSNSSKKKQGGIKVVYISNPMKVSTSASQFRALVQELTGQDSALPAEPARFSAVYSSSPNSSFIGEALPDSTVQNHHHHHEHLHDYALDREVASSPTSYQEQAAGSSNSNDSKNQHEIELYDDLFVPEMVDNFGGLLPSTVMYGSSS
ncbi:hypothetical protein ACFX2J_014381 [Malus domestica]